MLTSATWVDSAAILNFFCLVDIASALNVDYSHVENAAQQVAKADRDVHLVLGKTVRQNDRPGRGQIYRQTKSQTD